MTPALATPPAFRPSIVRMPESEAALAYDRFMPGRTATDGIIWSRAEIDEINETALRFLAEDERGDA